MHSNRLSPLVGNGAGEVCSLLPKHLDYLRERGIPPDVAAAAGLRSIGADEASKLLGYPVACSGLLIPYLEGPADYSRVRLDREENPRFLCPKGAEVPVYIPPNSRADSNESLVVCEGPIKGIALAAAGFNAVALGGIGTTLSKQADRHVLNGSWTRLRVADRIVFLMADTNRTHNPCVARDEARLAMALERAGCTDVRIARLSSGGDNEGPDDILAARGKAPIQEAIDLAIPAKPEVYAEDVAKISQDSKGALDSLLGDPAFLIAILVRGLPCQFKVEDIFEAHKLKAQLSRALKEAQRELDRRQKSQGTIYVYLVRDGVLSFERSEDAEPLANFNAWIKNDVTLDDGNSESKVFEVEGASLDGQKLPLLRLTPQQFLKEAWWLGWGANHFMVPGFQHREHLATAIQSLSKPQSLKVYSHTGWRKIEGRYAFLHGTGAVGAEGVSVNLEPGLDKFALPSVPVDLKQAIYMALQALDLAEPSVSFPLFLAVFRAPLQEAFYCDGGLLLHGRTGSLKSSTAAVFQSFFGSSFTCNSLPASFTDTSAALEYKANHAKDCLVVVDELTPRSTDLADDIRRNGSDLFRAIGNGAYRARMTPEMAARFPTPPRALIIATGEEPLSGEGIQARAWSIEFASATINRGVLTKLQGQTPNLAQALAGYLAYLAPRMDALRLWAKTRHAELRTMFELEGHRRAPSMAAHLALAAETFSEYAVASGAFSEAQATAFIERAHDALRQGLRAQQPAVNQENPGRCFLDLLNELFQSGRVALVDRNQPHLNGAIGWKGSDKVWLVPGLAFSAVAQFAKSQGQTFAVKTRSVWRDLLALGVMTKGDGPHWGIYRVVGGKKQRVIELERSAFDSIHEDGGLPGSDVRRAEEVGAQTNRLSKPQNKSNTQVNLGKEIYDEIARPGQDGYLPALRRDDPLGSAGVSAVVEGVAR